MSRFRLFGRPSAAAAPPTPLQLPPPSGAPAPWEPSPALFGGPATEAARPTAARPTAARPTADRPTADRPTAARLPTDDPPTDPFGMLPIPAPRADTAVAPRPRIDPLPFDTSPWPAPDPADAASLACAFAADYLSWDEDDPARRGRVLVDYLAAPGTDPAHLGWPGRGRQRAEFAIPGRARPDGDGRMLVDVRVRVTPYRRPVDARPGAPARADGGEPDIAGIPAAAPAPFARGWEGLASYWIRLSVPVVCESGRLVVDAWEETLGEELDEEPVTARVGGGTDPGEDHSLADDEPLVGQPLGGAW